MTADKISFRLPKEGEVYLAKIAKFEPNSGNLLVHIGSEKGRDKGRVDKSLLEGVIVDGGSHVWVRVKRIQWTKRDGSNNWCPYDLTLVGDPAEAIICSICGHSRHVVPSPRALHYVADQVLTDQFGNGSRKYKAMFGALTPGEFEDSMDDGMFPAVLAAGRELDSEGHDLALATILYPLAGRALVVNARKNIPNPNSQLEITPKPSIRLFLKWRIGRKLAKIDGPTFMRISSLISLYGDAPGKLRLHRPPK
jgi:hypothetical protein